MLTKEDIQNIIADHFKDLFHHSFPQLNNTIAGTPIPVFDQFKVQKYWFIPLLLNTKVRGSAIFDIKGNLVTHGVLTPNVLDEKKLIDIEYFERIPKKLYEEVRNFYKEYEIVFHFFSFDQTPQKWGWIIHLENKNSKNSVNVFVGPWGWYEKKVQNGLEG